MDIDQRTKQQSETETKEVDEILAEEKGLFRMAMSTYKGSLRRWVFVANIFIIIASIALVWAGYYFFVATDLDGRLFWGIVFLAALNAQISLKMWNFMEINRCSVIREIKRVELLITKMQN